MRNGKISISLLRNIHRGLYRKGNHFLFRLKLLLLLGFKKIVGRNLGGGGTCTYISNIFLKIFLESAQQKSLRLRNVYFQWLQSAPPPSIVN